MIFIHDKRNISNVVSQARVVCFFMCTIQLSYVWNLSRKPTIKARFHEEKFTISTMNLSKTKSICRYSWKENRKWFGTNWIWCDQRNARWFLDIWSRWSCEKKTKLKKNHNLIHMEFNEIHHPDHLVERVVVWLPIIYWFRIDERWSWFIYWTLHLQIDYLTVWPSLNAHNWFVGKH